MKLVIGSAEAGVPCVTAVHIIPLTIGGNDGTVLAPEAANAIIGDMVVKKELRLTTTGGVPSTIVRQRCPVGPPLPLPLLPVLSSRSVAPIQRLRCHPQRRTWPDCSARGLILARWPPLLLQRLSAPNQVVLCLVGSQRPSPAGSNVLHRHTVASEADNWPRKLCV